MPQPPVLVWFKVYAGFLALLYLACTIFGVAALLIGESHMEMSRSDALLLGLIFAGACGPLFLLCAPSRFLPPRPWV
jgi:hypothetical protein